MKKKALPDIRFAYGLGKGLFQCFMIILVIAVISLSFVACYRYLVTSPHLSLEQVMVRGVGESIRQDLIRECHLTSSLSLLAINLNELKYNMEKHPWVRSVTLERQFPHTLVVIAEEEKPSALVLTNGLYYMNRWGEIFKAVNDSDDVDFPVITGISQEVEDRGRQLSRAGYVIRSLETRKGPYSLDGLSEVHVEEDGCMSLYFSGLPVEVKLMCSLLPKEDNELSGNPERYLAEKIDGLRKVADHLKRADRINQVVRIDLDYRDGAVVSLKES